MSWWITLAVVGLALIAGWGGRSKAAPERRDEARPPRARAAWRLLRRPGWRNGHRVLSSVYGGRLTGSGTRWAYTG